MMNSTARNLLSTALLAVTVCALPALAGPDVYGLGDGTDGPGGASVINTVINRYARVTTAASAGSTSVLIASNPGIVAGDLVMVIQMTGINPEPSSGTPGPTDISNDPVGRWELGRVALITATTVTLTEPLLYSYAVPGSQVIRVPEYSTVDISGTGSIIASPWNGLTGGVVAFLATGPVTNFGSISATTRGFRAGPSVQDTATDRTGCTSLDEPVGAAGRKGEGIAFSRYGGTQGGSGRVTNGAGGGLCLKAGGGGGGNGGAGGQGGNSDLTLDGARAVGGQGGTALLYSELTRLVPGGGGGAGHASGSAGQPGGAGGGIIFFRAASLEGNGNIVANGVNAGASTGQGGGGGGAGGTIHMRLSGPATCNLLQAPGGSGSSTTTANIGPGGGGGGGRILYQACGVGICNLPATAVQGGAAGTQPNPGAPGGANYGAQNGAPGVINVVPGCYSPLPIPVVLTPAHNSSTNDTTPTYSGTVATPFPAGTEVWIYVDGALVGSVMPDAAGNWSFTPGLVLAQGVHNVYAVAVNTGLGQQSLPSSTNTFTVDLTPPPAPVVIAPANGAVTNDNTPTYAGTAEPGVTVTVIVDGVPVGTTVADAAGNWTFTPAVPVADGPHSVRATAADAAGNTSISSNTNTFVVDTIPPAAPVVLTPANGSVTSDNTPTYSGTAEAGVTVTVIVDGVSVGTTTANAAGTWTLTPAAALADGSHTVRATASDTAGNTSASSNTNTFIVDTTPPAAPVVQTPANGAVTNDNTPAYSGTAEAGSTVTVIVDGVSVGTTTANAAGNWTLTPAAPLADGPHTVSATATDVAGNTSASSNTNTFIVDTTPPAAPVVVTPANGSVTSDNTPAYSGTAEAGSTVTVIVDGVSVGTTTANAAGNWTLTPATALVDGPHMVRATATDAAGNTSASSNTNTFIVDTTPPAAPVVVTPANGAVTNDNTPAYSGTAEAGSTVTVIVDGVSVGTTTANAAGNWTLTPATALADGPHTVSATATDAAGNTSASSNTNTFIVDTTPPAAPVVVTPANGSVTSDNTPAYSGTAEAGSTVTVIVDGVSVGTTTANAAGNWTLTPATALVDGPHMVRATATDAAGNTSASSNTNTFIVDTTPPAAPVVVTPANGAVTNDNTPAYSGTAEAGSTVTVIVDGVSVGTTTANAAGTWTLTPATALADGPHTVSATATDAAGNTSASSNTNTFIVDTTPPAAPVVQTPADGSVTNDNTPDYSGTAEAGSTVTVIVDGVSVGTTTANAAGNWTFTPAAPLADGPHTVRATATDAAGNTSANSNTNTFIVDTTGPTVPVVLTPANGTVTSDNTPAYSGTAEADSTVTIFVDGVSVGTTVADAAGNWTFTPATALADGSHSVKVTATDTTGNTSPDSNTNTFIVDTTPPAAPVVLTPADGAVTNDNTPAYSGTAEAGSTVTVIVDGVSVGTTTANAAGNWTLTPAASLADGQHTVRATATDAAGNTGPNSSTNTFTVDTTAPAAPVVLTPADGTVTSDSTPTYSGTAEAGSTVTVIVDGISVGTATADGAGAWSFTPAAPLADGPHTVRATATDAAGNASLSSSTNAFIVDTLAPVAPVVLAPADGSVTSDNTPAYSGTAEAGSTVTVIVNGASVGTTTADGAGAWSLTPATALPDGQHTVRATATDAAGNTSPSSSTNTFTVDTTAPAAPVVLTPADGAVLTDNTPAYSGTAEAGTTVTVIVDGVSVGTVTADGTGAWSLTPAASLPDGQHTVRATATDAVGNTSPSSNTHTFTVDTTAPAAPVVITPADGSTINDNTPAYSGTAEAGSTVAVIVDGVQVGTTTATAAGTWSFTPTTGLPNGTHTVRATATDAVGNTSPDSNTNTFIVDATPPAAPVVITPANGVTINDNTPAYSGTAEAGSLITVIVDGSSVGTVTADAAGNWSLTPATALADGTHEVKARAEDATGNVSADSNTNTFTVDTTALAPVVFTPANGAVLTDNTPAYSGTAEAGNTVTVIVDGATVGTVTADAAGNWSFTPATALADGSHTVKATATDAVGNTSPDSNTNTFTVDTTPPAAPVLVTPANNSETNDTTPTFSGTAEANVTVTVFLDGTQLGTTTADAAGNWTFTPATALAQGTYDASAVATDAAGNTSPSSNVNRFTIDTTVVGTPVVTSPANNSVTSDTTPTITGTADANNTVTVSLNGAPVGTVTADASGTWSFTPATALADGPYAVVAVATDARGRTSGPSNTVNFTVDTTPPDTSIVSGPSGETEDPDAEFDFRATEPGVTYECSLDGAAAFTACTDPATFEGLALGEHTLQVRARDAAGNVDPTPATASWTVVPRKIDRALLGSGVGCAASGGSPSSLAMMGLAVLSALLARRRRR
jgi:uncharacterized protein (TIGR03382 family)